MGFVNSLPECLLLRILVHLPPPRVFRLRLVCKLWRALLTTSPSFLQALALHSPGLRIPCLAIAPPPSILEDQPRFLLYGLSLGAWFHKRFLLPSSSHALILSAAFTFACKGNLIVISPLVQITRRSSIRVANILTSSHQDIPFPPSQFSSHPSIIPSIGLFCRGVDDDEDDYHLALYHGVGSPPLSYIYTSRTQAWRSTMPSLPHNSYSFNAAEADLLFWNRRNKMLTIYCIESDEWSMRRVGFPIIDHEEGNGEASTFLLHPTRDGKLKKRKGNSAVFSQEEIYVTEECVFKCEGDRIVLVFAIVIDDMLSPSSKLKWRQVKGFQVWQLVSMASCGIVGIDTGRYKWVKVASSPPSFWDACYVETDEPPFEPKFVHDGTYIYMTGSKHSSSLENSNAFSQNKLGRYKPPLIYNMDLNAWSYLPHHIDMVDDVVGLFAFRPSLSALLKLYGTSDVQEQSQAQIKPIVYGADG